jgi:hypothetical protein
MFFFSQNPCFEPCNKNPDNEKNVMNVDAVASMHRVWK